MAVAKHDDHLPLYRQTEVYARSGVHIARSSMAQWLGICGVRLMPLVALLKDYILGHGVIHVDETPVSLLAPGKGKTKKAYVWVYRTTDFVSCNGDGEGKGRAVYYDYAGYHALHRSGVTAALCWAHAKRKLFEAHSDTGSEIAGQAVALIAKLFEIEREARDLSPQDRHRLRQQRSKPIARALHAWLVEKRQALAKADVTARAIDYSLSNWTALSRFLDDGEVPIDNNPAENAIRPLAVGRKNWLFIGSQQAGERAGNILSLIESAKRNGRDPWAYLEDVFERLPTPKNRDLAQLLPHNWHAPGISTAATTVTPITVPVTAVA